MRLYSRNSEDVSLGRGLGSGSMGMSEGLEGTLSGGVEDTEGVGWDSAMAEYMGLGMWW